MKGSAIWWKLENLKTMFGMCLIIIGFVNIARGIETSYSLQKLQITDILNIF